MRIVKSSDPWGTLQSTEIKQRPSADTAIVDRFGDLFLNGNNSGRDRR